MTEIHALLVGDRVLLPRSEVEKLVDLARRSEEIDFRVESAEDDIPAVGIMRLAEQRGAFAWLEDEEDLYSADDAKVRYRESP